MAGWLRAIIGDLSLDPDRAEARLERPADLARELRDGEDLGGLLKKIGGHGSQ